MVTSEVDDDTGNTASHLKCAFMTNRNIVFSCIIKM